MKSYSFLVILMLAQFGLVIDTTAFASPASSTEAALNCFLAYPTEAIMPTDPVYHSLPTADQQNPSIVACLGEAEPVQLVVETGSQAVENVTVRCSDMRSENDLLPASAIDIRYVGYVNSADTLWPDPLFENPDHGVDIAAQETKAWWITVNIPKDQTPGIYSGTLNTTGAGGVEMQIPFVVRVYNFAFPDPLPMGLSVGISLWPDVKPLAFARHFFPHHNQIGTDYTRPNFYIDQHGVVTVDFAIFDEVVSGLRDNWGMKRICLGFCLGDASGDYIAGTLTLTMIDQEGHAQQVSIDPREGGEHLAMFNSILSQYQQHLSEKGWLDDAFFYLWDEPVSPECIAEVNEMAPFFESAAPNIDTLLVAYPEEGRFPDSIDIYCVLANHQSVACSEWMTENNKELWYYSCGSAQNVSLTIGYPTLDYRLFGWLARRFDAVNTLYWTIDLGYETVVLRPDGLSFESCPRGGDGCLFYINPYGDVPLPSIRSENVRDGIEDAMILQMAADLMLDGKTVQQHVNELLPTQFSRNSNPRPYAELREMVYSLYSVPTDCADAIARGHVPAADLVPDCRINLLDFAVMAQYFLQCYDPTDSTCLTPWILN